MGKNYAIADLAVAAGDKPTLYLMIGESVYPVTQFNAGFGVSEIPQAQCLLALGRNARDVSDHATIHQENSYSPMAPAVVYFSPTGEYDPSGTPWPEGETVIFRGYFTGLAYRKMNGKIQVVANLIHWLFDLACSSCLLKNGHVANPTQLNVAAIMHPLDTANTTPIYTTSQLAGCTSLDIVQDLWGRGIKKMFCFLAGQETNPLNSLQHTCLGTGVPSINTRALAALKLMEGDAPDCPFTPLDGDKRYGTTLGLDITEEIIIQSVIAAIGAEGLTNFANTTFWDKLISQYCPSYGMAVVPMVERALVIADLGSYRGDVWRTIDHTEVDSFDMSAMLERPLRGVGVIAEWTRETNAAQGVIDQNPSFGGCYIAGGADGIDAGDGILQIISPPTWLNGIGTTGRYAGTSLGVNANTPVKQNASDSQGTPATDAKLDSLGISSAALYSAYAKWFYVNNQLRGRTGTLSGKLRFDIAPGSLIRIRQRGELFLPKDDLATTLIACVNRVTVTINAEAKVAATSFNLTHIRRERPENSQDRTSCDEHPLFRKQIHGGGKHGAPLVPKYEFA